MRLLSPFSATPSLNSRFAQLVLLAAILTAAGWLYVSSFGGSGQTHIPLVTSHKGTHPIDTLIQDADRISKTLLAQETTDVESAARVYRELRGRHPPPGFDTWFKFAQDNKAVIVEDFFDQIYHDLNPFWGIPAREIRQQANDFVHRISVRSGNVTQRTDIDQRPWMDLWQDLVQSIAQHLPDIDLAINVMDESRLVVPWETVDTYMTTELKGRRLTPISDVVSKYSGLVDLDRVPPPPFDPEFLPHGPYWSLAVAGCPPGSPARSAPLETNFSTPPLLPLEYPLYSYQGYVSNWTLAKSPCDNPNLQGLHGTFVEPISISTSKKLFPLFGGSKLPMNNEILLPPAMYWTSDPFYSGGAAHGGPWEEKLDKLIWRGAASGGRNTRDNWTRFQRHRFVSMMNGTSIREAETSSQSPPNFDIPSYTAYQLTAPRNGYLGDWVAAFADTAFVHLLCFPDEGSELCSYTSPYYEVAKEKPMKEQYANKYLPDIDGNSFSGRYRGFLGSTSVPIKATIYNEWHDSRLVPWKHFIPMDNTFVDIYGIMDYFLGFRGIGGHDNAARNIALDGKAWAEKVLRREDMQIYALRLLLEYARICDDNRERMGWVEDLKA
ncbi:hypothetical protein LTR50_004026 [Elasticomyces elasticus]|nr:hypothetical protein LTR50_004026 [Elasticomyces elasticus]